MSKKKSKEPNVYMPVWAGVVMVTVLLIVAVLLIANKPLLAGA